MSEPDSHFSITISAIQMSGARSVRVDASDGTPLGFLEVDRIVAGRCCGGIRASDAVTPEELRRIAAVMTLKCGFVGLAAGGAKGGIIMPSSASSAHRTERLAAYGRAMGPILRSGLWSYGVDLGTTSADINVIRHNAGLGSSRPGDEGDASRTTRDSDASSADAAGLTVGLSAEAALEYLGTAVQGARIAVQGGGAVGRAAIAALGQAGARIVAVATVAGTLQRDEGFDVSALLDGLARSGDDFVRGVGGVHPAQAVLEVDCDALLACAGTATFDAPAAARLRARAVVCGANIPLAEGVEDCLFGRGVLVVPDFVAGAGGVLGTTLETAAGATAAEVASILRRRFKPLVAATVAAAAARGEPPAAEARRRAFRILAACDKAYNGTRPPTLLPDRLAPALPAAARVGLALERRARDSSRLSTIARRLHGRALARAEQVLDASLAAGTDGTAQPRWTHE